MSFFQSLENKAIAWGWNHYAVNAIRHKRTTICGLASGAAVIYQALSYIGNGGTPDMQHLDLWAGLLAAAWLGINGKDSGTQDVALDGQGNPIPKALPAE